jgi:hypothetical protein
MTNEIGVITRLDIERQLTPVGMEMLEDIERSGHIVCFERWPIFSRASLENNKIDNTYHFTVKLNPTMNFYPYEPRLKEGSSEIVIPHELGHAFHILEFGFDTIAILKEQNINGKLADLFTHTYVRKKVIEYGISKELALSEYRRLKRGFIDSENDKDGFRPWYNALISFVDDENVASSEIESLNPSIIEHAIKINEIISDTPYDESFQSYMLENAEIIENYLNRIREAIVESESKRLFN